MSSDSPERPHNYFRGQERVDLVEDLAQGGLTHAQLADKYGRHIQTIHQFSARNHYEIEHRRRELHGLLNEATADEWVKDKAALYALYCKPLIAPTTAGKSWFAAWQTKAVLESGGAVAYAHFEDA